MQVQKQKMAMAREVGSSPGEGSSSMAVAMEHAPAQDGESISSLLKVLFKICMSCFLHRSKQY